MVTPTRTKGVFCPGWWLQPGLKGWAFCSRWSHQPGQKEDLWCRLVPPTETKDPYPPLARLAVGPGTKATFGPGSKDNRDKWLGSKACSVVVNQSKIRCISLTLHATHCFPLGIPHLVATIQNVRCDISYLSQPTKF